MYGLVPLTWSKARGLKVRGPSGISWCCFTGWILCQLPTETFMHRLVLRSDGLRKPLLAGGHSHCVEAQLVEVLRISGS